MYAIVKTGGKQYKVAPGDKINIEKLDVAVGESVELPVICVVDGANVEADPAKAAATKVTATVLEQFKDSKQVVFKLKKRKNYKRLRGHRQQLTRVEIDSVGSERAVKAEDDAEVEDATEEVDEKLGAAVEDEDFTPAAEDAKAAVEVDEAPAEDAAEAEDAADEAEEKDAIAAVDDIINDTADEFDDAAVEAADEIDEAADEIDNAEDGTADEVDDAASEVDDAASDIGEAVE